MGISGTNLSPDIAAAAKLDANQRGALVGEVTPDSPADKAGLHGSDRQAEIDGQTISVGGDVITTIDGHAVNSMEELIAYLISQTKVDQQVTLTVLRDGQTETVKVTLAPRPQPQNQANQPEVVTSGGAWLGILGATMNPELADAMDLPSDQTGVMVGRVEIDSPADKAGLHGSFQAVTINGERQLVGGDVITAVDGQPINDVSDLQAFIHQAKAGQKAAFTIVRDGKQLDLTLTIGARPAN